MASLVSFLAVVFAAEGQEAIQLAKFICLQPEVIQNTCWRWSPLSSLPLSHLRVYVGLSFWESDENHRFRVRKLSARAHSELVLVSGTSLTCAGPED